MARLIGVTRERSSLVQCDWKNVMRLPNDVRERVRFGVTFGNIDRAVLQFRSFVVGEVGLNDFVSADTTDVSEIEAQ